MKKMWQQGDVLMFDGAVIPVGAQKVDHLRLADGEMTGHAHVACGEGVELLEHDGVLYLSAPNGAEVTHEEHRPVTIPAGAYRVGRVQEYDYDRDEARRVAD